MEELRDTWRRRQHDNHARNIASTRSVSQHTSLKNAALSRCLQLPNRSLLAAVRPLKFCWGAQLATNEVHPEVYTFIGTSSICKTIGVQPGLEGHEILPAMK